MWPKKFKVPDNKITLVTVKFSVEEFEKIKKVHRLNETMVDVMHLINLFAKRHNIKDEVKIHMADDTL